MVLDGVVFATEDIARLADLVVVILVVVSASTRSDAVLENTEVSRTQ